MKKFKLFLGIIALAGGFTFSSCVKDDFDTPPVLVPEAGFESNISIANFKALYSGNGVDSIAFDTIIQGIVVGNDESGNIYKSLIIQDQSGGIEIKLDQSSLYNQYRIGQKIYVKCKGMYLGTYGGLVQLGYLYQGSIGRMPEIFIKDHLFLDSLPGKPLAPALKTIATLSPANLSTIVRFDSVSFDDGGARVFCEQSVSSADDRVMRDKNGSTILVRTSKYANFASDVIPSGIGSVVGVLSIYNGAYQLYIRDRNDIINFQPDSNVYLLNHKFSALAPFTQYSVVGSQVWTASTYGGVNFAQMSGYQSGYFANEDWLISPALNLDLYTNEKFKFDNAMKYGSAGDGTLKAYYSVDYLGTGDPNQATWTEFTGVNYSTGNFTWAQSGEIDMSAINGTNVYIAFKYVCGTSGVPTWEVTNVSLQGKKL